MPISTNLQNLFRTTTISGADTTKETISQGLQKGFMEGRTIQTLVRASMKGKDVNYGMLASCNEDGTAKSGFIISSEKGTSQIELMKKPSALKFFMRSVVHHFKMSFSEEYKTKFTEATDKIAALYIDFQSEKKTSNNLRQPQIQQTGQAGAPISLASKSEQLNAKKSALEEEINKAEASRPPEKSEYMQTLEASAAVNSKKTATFRTGMHLLNRLDKLVDKEDKTKEDKESIKKLKGELGKMMASKDTKRLDSSEGIKSMIRGLALNLQFAIEDYQYDVKFLKDATSDHKELVTQKNSEIDAKIGALQTELNIIQEKLTEIADAKKNTN